MENLPVYISIIFLLTTILTAYFFFAATSFSKPTMFISICWLLIQAMIAGSEFYTTTDTIPPRLILALGPPLALIIFLFSTKKGRNFIDSIDIGKLSLIHTIRIPVEFILLWLSIYKLLPSLITFEGRNLDILSGLTAPIIYYFGFVKYRLGKGVLLTWNFICLALLLNVVIHALLSVPTPFQKFGFEQPNTAILYFPFVWLACFIVPVVFFSHLVSIRQLLLTRSLSIKVSV